MPDFTSGFGPLVLVALAGYLVGSIPFGLVMARLFGLGDIRKIGSGNIGATNVLRTGNKAAAALTLVLDAAKGGLAALAGRWLLGEDAAQVAGGFAFLGHLYPIWLGFRGGKGVATFLGTLLAVAWPVGVAACATWLAVAAVARRSSLAALLAAALSSLWALLLDRTDALLLITVLTALVFWRHRTNIQRLKAGTEPRIGQK
jgi:glycerol-3-phosphate acyltransferase PlsY